MATSSFTYAEQGCRGASQQSFSVLKAASTRRSVSCLCQSRFLLWLDRFSMLVVKPILSKYARFLCTTPATFCDDGVYAALKASNK